MNILRDLALKAWDYIKSKPGLFASIGAAIVTFFAGHFSGKATERRKNEKEKRRYIDAIAKHEAKIRRLESLEMSDRKKSKLIKKQQRQIDALRSRVEELESRASGDE